MDTLTVVVIVALVCAIILFEVNKRQSAKITVFFTGNNIALLLEADRKIKAISSNIDDARSQYGDEGWQNSLLEQLALKTDRYENNEITLSDYNIALDGLLGSLVYSH